MLLKLGLEFQQTHVRFSNIDSTLEFIQFISSWVQLETVKLKIKVTEAKVEN